jgi:signal peptidase II
MPNRIDRTMRQTAMRTLWVALAMIVIDQLTKVWAVGSLTLGEPVAVLPHLNWTLVYNYGAAFSFLADMGGWQRWFFTALALLVSTILLAWLRKLPNRLNTETWGINLVLGGALGNLIDRVVEGRVTDFVDFYIGSWHYATFNVADIAITVGAGLLILSELILKPRAEKARQNAQ